MIRPYLGTNASFEEIVRYGTDEQLRESLGREANRLAEAQDEIKQQDRRIEILEEQLYFAEELLELIEQACDSETRARDLKRAIKAAIENSSLER